MRTLLEFFTFLGLSWKVFFCLTDFKKAWLVFTLKGALSRLSMVCHPITLPQWLPLCFTVPLFTFAWWTNRTEKTSVHCRRKCTSIDHRWHFKKRFMLRLTWNVNSVISIIEDGNQKSLRSHPEKPPANDMNDVNWEASIEGGKLYYYCCSFRRR